MITLIWQKMISEIFFSYRVAIHLLFEGEPHHSQECLEIEAKTRQTRQEVLAILDGDDFQVDSIEIISIKFPASSPYSRDDLSDDAEHTIKECGISEAKSFCVEFAFNSSFI